MGEKKPEDDYSFSLKEMIREVQNELVESQRDRERSHQEALFELEKVDLEVNFVVTRDHKAKGGVSFKIPIVGGFEVGAEGAWQNQFVHKVAVSLKAVAPESESPAQSKKSSSGVDPPPSGPRGRFPHPSA